MGTTVASSVADSHCEVCWLSSGSNPFMVSSLWPLPEPFSIMLVVGYTIYHITFWFWIMETWSTCPFSYSYLIQLPMWPTLKELKCVNHHLLSLQKFTDETRKTLCDHFWCGISKLDTLYYLLLIQLSIKLLILDEVCLGLRYLHSRNPSIVHSDLTPTGRSP